ncbi:alpha/beta hydrolase [Glutamicibacter sp. MNS18]|uniref:alpha/beta hydrolase n=1 Tax=Glutamicibacter sp. MNS18 TaxID=2989817 RepID=UPI0022359B23|nr:alpha/beta hydrolase [Glutamicibacter sp. MNS18]MCW4466535.1 alpha/beta hydrolase [Glutamicibacter sp. MNS18]
MTNKTILLFLHGVGDGDPQNDWKDRLSQSLVDAEYPSLDDVELIVPKFAHALKGADEFDGVPPITYKRPRRSEAGLCRREFEHRMAGLEFKLGRHDSGNGWPLGESIIDVAFSTKFFTQASNYMRNERIRAGVLARILKRIPAKGRIVIVGHSLGSVIAADLLLRLPSDIEVVGMVTIGSPLGHRSFDVEKLGSDLKDPPTHLSWWVNIWNDQDPVASHRGVCSVFPWMTDHRITSKPGPSAHRARTYFSDPVVAEAVGYALFGSKSKEIVKVSHVLDVQPNETERIALLALRYAHLINGRLEGDLKDRYSGALRQVQATLVDGLQRWNEREGRPTPHFVSRLAFDLSDQDADVPEPFPGPYLAIDDAIEPMIGIASENIIAPFEITVSMDIKEQALRDLTAEHGLTSKFGEEVFKSAKRATEVLNGGRSLNWKKWGVVGLGAVALVAATGGLALAAAPGLAGAAVLTSALATFGPGGMVGGLITAGSLVGVGGGSIAYGLASPGTSAVAMEAVIERMLTAAILRKNQGLPPDPSIWKTLVEIEIQVRREYERLDEYSDGSSAGLAELKKKITAVERALEFLRLEGMEPGEDPDTE